MTGQFLPSQHHLLLLQEMETCYRRVAGDPCPNFLNFRMGGTANPGAGHSAYQGRQSPCSILVVDIILQLDRATGRIGGAIPSLLQVILHRDGRVHTFGMHRRL